MTDKATITGLAIGPEAATKALHREPALALELVAGKGVKGDKKFGRSPTRQVNLINARSYAWFAASFGRTLSAPGAFGEQVVVSDAIDLGWLPLGARLQIGKAVLEIATFRTPCETAAGVLATESPSHLVGHVGVLCRVIEGGEIRLGDAVQVI